MEPKAGFLDYFKNIPDHRIERRKLYSVEEILLLTFCGIISGCDSWEDIEIFGQTKLSELREYLPFEFGTPSDDTLRRFFRILDANVFEEAFMSWVKSFQLNFNNMVVAIDGKTSKGSADGAQKAIHMVSAFASELGITLGQVKTEEKSNEITAIPELLKLLDIKGSIVTIDAMGCQHKIASAIRDKEADYLLSLKGNQGSLHDDIIELFDNPPKDLTFETHEDVDKGHGRIEIRRSKVTTDIDWVRKMHPKWKDLNSIIEIESTRIIKDETTVEKRYYISSLKSSAAEILNATRSHWGIENSLHWVLDVSFNDDDSKVKKGNAPQNMTIVKKTALNLMRIVKRDPIYKRLSLKRMRKLCGWDNSFLQMVLGAKF
jgi:predicted transposase YbfD/YdcC